LDLLLLSREDELGAYRHSPELGWPTSLQKQVVKKCHDGLIADCTPEIPLSSTGIGGHNLAETNPVAGVNGLFAHALHC
jgi:hypothetical protein